MKSRKEKTAPDSTQNPTTLERSVAALLLPVPLDRQADEMLFQKNTMTDHKEEKKGVSDVLFSQLRIII